MERPRPLKLTNQLENSKSPYVRGHRHNPVAWQMWGESAFSLAKKHNRLIFLSIGYAACHWCHVMERESFENEEIAAVLNASFVPIKVDREERPDVDRIYMDYVQATTGSGGWPLNVFITPDLEPVFGGTYWPGPNSSTPILIGGEQVTFLDVLKKMASVWVDQEDRCRQSAKEILEQLKSFAEEGTFGDRMGDGDEGLDIELLEDAYQHFARKFDRINGGFAVAPKFPTPANLKFLLQLQAFPQEVYDIVSDNMSINASSMAMRTLRRMARGGIHDQIGGGFHRYSVTADWSLPHFEKMLYDNAQLLSVYLDAFLLSKDPEMLGAVYSTASYLLHSDITAPEGVLYSSEDADSLPTKSDTEKREGAFYVFTRKELTSILGEQDAEVASKFYNVGLNGNVGKDEDLNDEFLDQNVLQIVTTPAALASEMGMSESEIVSSLKTARSRLKAWREKERPRPNVDDKVLAGWNGLAISSLARASAVLEDIDPAKANEYCSAAIKAALFIRNHMYDASTGLLKRLWRRTVGDTFAFADDYAFLIQGLIDLYEATFDESYLEWADKLQQTQIQHFHDPSSGGFFTTPSLATTPDLILRLKSGMDNAEPSTNGISAQNLFRLGSLLADDSYTTYAKSTVQAFEAELLQHPFLFASMLLPVVESRLGMKGVVVVGRTSRAGQDWLRAYRGRVSVGETVVRLDDLEDLERLNEGGKKKSWLRSRNTLLSDLKGPKILVCEGRTCRELELDLGIGGIDAMAKQEQGQGMAPKKEQEKEKGLDMGRVKDALEKI